MVHSPLVGKGRLARSLAHSRLHELNNARFQARLHFTQTRWSGRGWALSAIAPRAVRGRKGAERISQPCAEVINIYKYFNRSILLQALAESFYRMRLSALLLLLLLLLLCLQQLRQQQKASTPLLMPLHPKHSENRANHCF